jgi:hypothetical protein
MQEVRELVGDDTVREQDVPSITMDPSSDSARATPGETPPSAGTKMMVTVMAASPGQILPKADKPVSASALGVGPAPRVLKKKKLLVKKSRL